MGFVSQHTVAHEIILQLMQYRGLAKATIATTTISMLSSILIIVHYILMRCKEPDKANRVSLRCVVSASCMNLIDSIFDLCTILVYGDTAFCKSSAVITMFARVMSSTLLSLVGVNLVLVFVINIKGSTARQLEWGYYLGAFIYALITISVPISEEVKSSMDVESPLRCYYHIYYYQVFGHSSLLWMWYYAFLFLTTIIAVVCSITASIKLMHEQHNILNRFSTIANDQEATAGTDASIQICMTNNSGVFRKVVGRCILYPLVPFISNIWGFIAQLIIVSGSTPSFSLSVVDNVFGCLQGFFVAIIFFNDPAMLAFIRQGFKSWKRKRSVTSISRKTDRDFDRLESSMSESNTGNIPGTKNDESLQMNKDNLLQIPPSSYNSKDSREGPSSRSYSSFSLSSFDDNPLTKDDHRVSYCDDSDTIVVPMRRLELPNSLPVTLNNEDVRLDSPASTYGGSTLDLSERRGSSLT